jgi:pimeloyl-ACP methyl ester carboxylesterase
LAAKVIWNNNRKFSINYEIINNDKKNIIVFLHGWGSNKEVMKQAFANKLEQFKHIYIDMPGFGKSQNDHILTTIDYASVMKDFLEELGINHNEVLIAGHSFGGKVATMLMPKLLILLSSAGILEEKSTKTLLTIRMAKIFNRFGLSKVNKMLRSKDVDNMPQNMYETFKNVVDEDFSEYFKGFYNEALIFWGTKDEATTLSSGVTINKLIKNSSFKSYDGDHYFFMQHANDICDTIVSHLENKVS